MNKTRQRLLDGLVTVAQEGQSLCIYTFMFLYAHACMCLPSAAYSDGGTGLFSSTSKCCPSDPVHGSDIQFIAAIVHYRATIYLCTAQLMLSTHALACCNPKETEEKLRSL